LKLRSQLLLAFSIGALVPMIALALVVRHEMTTRLNAQSQQRVDALVSAIESDMAREGDEIHAALAQISDAISSDNRFRRAAVDAAESERRYLLDYAGNAMHLAGLEMLQIHDDDGRIVSSGHFRNDYDRREPALPKFLGALPDRVALVRARTAAEPLLVLASVDSVAIGRSIFTLVGGIEAGSLDRLARGSSLGVTLVLPGDSLATADTTRTIVKSLPVLFYDTETHIFRMAALRVTNDMSELRALRQSVDRWFLIAVSLTALAILLLATWLANRVSRPVVELAEKAERVDLDQLDVDFDSGRPDEVGTLSRGLAAMTKRLRDSRVRLKDAEKRATMGDLARQVNHDLKNGLTPVRNVFRHLMEQSEGDAEELRSVLRERSTTIDQSIGYLEKLASNYARLSRKTERERCDLNQIVRQVATGARGSARIETVLADGAVVNADPVSLRRIIENLVDNAIDSLNGSTGAVTLETQVIRDGPFVAPRVRLIVADTGAGMNDIQRARIFDDFYTTKPDGSGLGLSIVRRLVMDLGGTVKAESTPGEGSRFVVDLPAPR